MYSFRSHISTIVIVLTLTLLGVAPSSLFGQQLVSINATTPRRSNWIDCTAVSPDGRVLATGGGGFEKPPELKLWSISTGKQLASLIHDEVTSLRADSVSSLMFAPDGKLLASGEWNGEIRLWDTRARRKVATLKAHTGRVNAIAFSPDGTRLASASSDGSVVIWNVSTHQVAKTLKTDLGRLSSVAYSPDGALVTAGDRLGDIYFLESTSGELKSKLEAHFDEVTSLAFSPDGERMASASEDGTLKIWAVETGRKEREIDGDLMKFYSVAFSPDGSFLAGGGGKPDRETSLLKLWEVSSGKEVRVFTGHKDAVKHVTFSPDGTFLASASKDNTVKIWNMNKETSVELTNKEWQSINGWWSVDSMNLSGTSLLEDGKTKPRLHINNGTVTVKSEGAPDKPLVFAVDFSKDPKTATAVFEEKGVPISVVAIFSRDSDDLRICLNGARADLAEEKRPKRFDSDECVLITLKREDATAPNKKNSISKVLYGGKIVVFPKDGYEKITYVVDAENEDDEYFVLDGNRDWMLLKYSKKEGKYVDIPVDDAGVPQALRDYVRSKRPK